MKYFLLILVMCFTSITANAFQADISITVPKPEDVQKIETTKNQYRYQTPESLLRMLPRLSAKPTAKYGDCERCQYGTITLKNGTVLKWKSSHVGNVSLYNDNVEQLYTEDSSTLEVIWEIFGNFFCLLALFLLIAFFVVVFFNQRVQLTAEFPLFREQTKSEYLKILTLRMTAFLLFIALAWLIFQSPLQQFHDGIAIMHQKGGPTHYAFAETEPGNFKFSLILESSFGVVSIFCGILFLCFNPKSQFLAKKPKVVIEKTSFLGDQ